VNIIRIGKEYRRGRYRSILKCDNCNTIFHEEIQFCEKCGSIILDVEEEDMDFWKEKLEIHLQFKKTIIE